MATWTDPTDGRVYTLVPVACALCGASAGEVFPDATNRVFLCDPCDDALYQRWAQPVSPFEARRRAGTLPTKELGR